MVQDVNYEDFALDSESQTLGPEDEINPQIELAFGDVDYLRAKCKRLDMADPFVVYGD